MKLLLPVLALLLAGCASQSAFERPRIAGLPDHWNVPAGFQLAASGDAKIPTDWWKGYQDPILDELIAQVASANQTLAQADAQYREAVAAAGTAGAALYPTGTITAGGTRSKTPSFQNGGGVQPQPALNLFSAGAQVSWEPDLWGALHATLASARATALSAFDQRDATLLSLQATLAGDYFQLRVDDATIDLLSKTADSYQKNLELTQTRYRGGVATMADVTQAEGQLQSALAALADARISRATTEHAIAVLVGKAASDFSIAPIQWMAPAWPPLPLSLPSTLLERRPDFASAERQVDAAASRLVATRAAFFPVVELTASAGFESRSLGNLFSLPSRMWSIGPQLTQYFLDGGAHVYAEDQAVATVDQAAANYREVVLEGFQAVEDNLVTLRWLDEEQERQRKAVKAAEQSLDIITRQYKGGTVDYLNVITAQTTLLSAQSAVLSIEARKAVAHVTLVKSLGGGWQAPASGDGELPRLAGTPAR